MSISDQHQMLVRQVDLFRGLRPEDISRIFAKGMTVQAQKDQTVFYKGTTGNKMYVILAGTIGLYDGERSLATLKSGDLFGEMALISNEPRSATAVAEEISSLFVLDETTFDRLLTKRVAVRILLNILGTLSNRLREANKKLRAQ